MRAKKFLSMLLVVVMMLSLFPMNAFALGGGREIGIGGGFGRDIGDDEIREFDPTDYEAEGEDPVDFFQTTDYESGITVTVASPFNALPTKAEVRLQPVDPESVREAVESVVEGQPNILVAMDISFWLDGQEIEPDQPVNVKISAPELTDVQNLQVVHIPDAGEEDAQPNTVELVTEEEMSIPVGTNEIAFKANSFSVYAVIGGEIETARVQVDFIRADGDEEEVVATIFVKKDDLEAENAAELEKIVYDPGVGSLSDRQMFKGWMVYEDGSEQYVGPDYTLETKPMNIEDVRNYLRSIKDTIDEDPDNLKVIDVYAMIYNRYTVTYLNDKGNSMGSHTAMFMPGDPYAEYTVDMAYTPDDNEHNFEGWNVYSGSQNIIIASYQSDPDDPTTAIDASEPYQNGTVLRLQGDVVLSVNAPAGHWLIFNENLNGAPYNAAIFVEGENVVPERPSGTEAANMLRVGYTFQGWFKGPRGTVDSKTGYGEPQGAEYNFDEPMTDHLTVYAKWEKATTADYTVLIWKQNAIDRTKYDYAEAIPLTNGSVDNPVTTVSSSGTGDNAVAVVNGTRKVYDGFHLDHYDEDVVVKADGSTVVNVYYNRTQYTLTFKAPQRVNNPSTSDTELYGYVEAVGGYVKLTRRSNRWQFQYDGDWYYYSTYGNGYYYHYNTIKTITGYYEQNIASEFPIVGSDGVTYTGWVWDPQNSAIYTSGQVPSLDTINHENTVFHALRYGEGTTIHLYYYVEALEGDTDTVTYGGKQFTEYRHVQVSSNGGVDSTEAEDFSPINGFTQFGSDPAYVNGRVSLDETNNYTIKLYYQRKEYPIVFQDGVYIDGDGNAMEHESLGKLGESRKILYADDISSFNEGGDDYYTPANAPDGFLLEGWYIDESCSKKYDFDIMPEGGVTVYAKWQLIQFRVYLHPNVPTDQDFTFGNEKQSTCFRIDYNEKISSPTARDYTDHKMVGWYLDPEFEHPYNPDAYPLNSHNVTTPYDQDNEYTETDKHGTVTEQSNSDKTKNRWWIEYKLDLYLKWKAELPGAEGINVEYDVNGGTHPGATADGLVLDPQKYDDNSKAVAIGASTAPAAQGTELNKHFKYWIVQKYVDGEEDGEFVDTDTHVYPGDNFVVLKANSKVEDLPAEQQTETVNKKYTVRLKAFYDVENQAPTHIYWFANNGSGDVQKNENIKINEAIYIPTPENYTPNGGNRAATGLSFEDYTFIGWAKCDAVESSEESGSEESSTNTEIKEFGYDDLFLRWEDDKYLAEVDGEWVEVDRVAADEVTPYEDLYAVWVKTFYVYHTGTNQVERVMLPASSTSTEGTGATFSLTALVDTNRYLYGGYYMEYAGASSTFKSNVDGLAYTRAGSISGYDDVAQINRLASMGNVFTANDIVEGNGKAVAYTGDTTGMFTNAYTVDPGNAIHPAAGAVYYIKEVPAADFLQPRLRYTYRAIDGKIGTAWLLTNMDDDSYGDVGFMIGTESVVCTGDGDKVTSFTMTPKTDESKAVTYYVGDAPAGTGTKEKLFPKGALFSYTKVYNKAIYDTKPELNEGEEISTLKPGEKVVMFWVTPDGMKVTSTATRTYTNIDTTALSIKDSTPQTSSITLYSAS